MINYTNAHSKKESKAVFWCSFQTTKPLLESKFFFKLKFINWIFVAITEGNGWKPWWLQERTEMADWPKKQTWNTAGILRCLRWFPAKSWLFSQASQRTDWIAHLLWETVSAWIINFWILLGGNLTLLTQLTMFCVYLTDWLNVCVHEWLNDWKNGW